MAQEIKNVEKACRQIYTISELWNIYLDTRNDPHFRYRFEEKSLSKKELIDLIEILTIKLDDK